MADAARSAVLARLRAAKAPYVLVYNRHARHPCVSVDGRAAVTALVARLHTLGHRRILMVSGALATTDRALSGEIAILLDCDFNACRAKYEDQANVEFVIPAEGTVVAPYVTSAMAQGPNAANGRKALDFILSDEGQAIWAHAFLRPVRASAIAKEAQPRFLPASECARARTVDYGRMAEAQKAFSERYLREAQ